MHTEQAALRRTLGPCLARREKLAEDALKSGVPLAVELQLRSMSATDWSVPVVVAQAAAQACDVAARAAADGG